VKKFIKLKSMAGDDFVVNIKYIIWVERIGIDLETQHHSGFCLNDVA